MGTVLTFAVCWREMRFFTAQQVRIKAGKIKRTFMVVSYFYDWLHKCLNNEPFLANKWSIAAQTTGTACGRVCNKV